MKNIKNRKYKGSVLLTVVSVMALLIVFLFGTLVLATSANNRAHINYSSAQTNVTSRLVAESAITAIDLDKDYRKAIGGIKSGDSPLKVPVQISSDDTNINTRTMGKIDDVEVSYAGTRKFYDTTKNEWLDRELIRFTSKVTLGGVTSTTNAYVLKHMSDDDDSSPSGAGFVTTGGADFKCQTCLYGGAYVNIPNPDSVKEYKNYEDPAVYKCLPYYAGGPKMNLYNSAGVIEADAVINTNVFVNNWSGFIFPGPGKGVTVWGDMAFSGNSADHLSFINACTLGTDTYNFNEIPYLYVDGGIYPADPDNPSISYNGSTDGIAAKIGIGNSGIPAENKTAATAPFNIFAGYIYSKADNYLGIFGDLYLMDSDKTSVIVGNNAKLYTWSNSVVNKTKSTSATAYTSAIYSNGSMELGGCTIDGDVRIARDCIISSDVTINGDLVVGGKLLIQNNSKITMAAGKKIYTADSKAQGYSVASGYKKVDTILHEATTEPVGVVVEVPNDTKVYYAEKQYPYYEWNFGEHPNGEKTWEFLNPWGEVQNGAYNTTVYYRWIDSYDAEANGIPAEDEVADYLKRDNVPDGDVPYYYSHNLPKEEHPANPIDGSREYYYVKSVVDPDSIDLDAKTYSTYPSSVEADEASYLFDLENMVEVSIDETYVEIPAYRTLPNYDNSEMKVDGKPVKTEKLYVYFRNDETVKDDPSKIVSETEATRGNSGDVTVNGVTMDSVANYRAAHGNEQVYPKYAEKKVLLGIELVPDPSDSTKTLKKSETQVVKTMKDVLEQVINPYDNSDIPSALKAKYNTIAASGKILRSKTDIATEMGETVSHAFNGDKMEITTATGSAGAPLISKDCILDWNAGNGGELADSDGNKCIVFAPNGSDILVIIRKFEVGAGVDIIVDDSKGGKVYFYLDKGAQFSLNAGYFTTPSWYNLLKSGTSFQVTSDQAYTMYGADGVTAEPKTVMQLLGTRAVPNVYFYGAKGSKIIWPNFGYCTANIVSPNIKLEMKGGPDFPGKNSTIYYNGQKISAASDGSNYPIIFGCCNSKTADFPNQINELWVTDGGGKTPPTPPTDDEFWYKVLYYDEY